MIFLYSQGLGYGVSAPFLNYITMNVVVFFLGCAVFFRMNDSYLQLGQSRCKGTIDTVTCDFQCLFFFHRWVMSVLTFLDVQRMLRQDGFARKIIESQLRYPERPVFMSRNKYIYLGIIIICIPKYSIPCFYII